MEKEKEKEKENQEEIKTQNIDKEEPKKEEEKAENTIQETLYGTNEPFDLVEEVQEEPVANININSEINKKNSKEEDFRMSTPVSQEQNLLSKSYQKRPSHMGNFINPLNDENEEIERVRPRGFAHADMSKKKLTQKSLKIMVKSNMLENLLLKKSALSQEEFKETNDNKLQPLKTENISNKELYKRNSLKDNSTSKNKLEEFVKTQSNQSIEKEDDEMSNRTVSTEYSWCLSFAPDIELDSITYDKYLDELKQKGIKEADSKRESFCEGFFLASFPYKNGQAIENSNNDNYPASCHHLDCSKLHAMKPEILLRYPLEDTKNLELNNLAATICFPIGIKVCYSENEPPNCEKDYITNITNQKGERYYMMTYHFYVRMMNDEYTKLYEMHPLKHNLMKFGDAYLTYREEEFTPEVTEKVQKTLEFCQDLGFREYVYIPYCLCLISKYPYSLEMERCLQSIFQIIQSDNNENFTINDVIMYLIHSVPIPDKNNLIKFYLPYCNKSISFRKSTNINGLNIMNIDFAKLTTIFSINNIIIIFRLLLSEKKILFIDDDYSVLSKVTDAFISLLYPFKWIHTYIPIMSEQMLKYLESFLPFVNGIHSSLKTLVKNIFNEGEIDESEEVFLVYIKENDIQIGSSLKNKKIKMSKYIQNNVLPLPGIVEKELKKKLQEIKEKFEINQKNTKKKNNNNDIIQLDLKFRDAFIDAFVYLFHDYQKYIGLLDDDEVIFNKNLFMQSVKKEDKNFYDQFLDSQLFEQFTQNILNCDIYYFNKKIELFGKKEKDKEILSVSTSFSSSDKNYLVKPDFLKLEEEEINNTTLEKCLTGKYKISFKTDDKGIILPSQRIITKLNLISNEGYDNSKCFIYLLPEKKETPQSNKQEKVEEEDYRTEFLKKINAKRIFPALMGNVRRRQTHINAATKEKDLTDKKKELIKEEIKDWIVKIFKSEVEDYKDNPKIKTDVLSLINNQFGIKCFVDLISHNKQTITMLQKSSFRLLGFIIYNALLFLLNYEETDQVIEECVLLFKSTKSFCVNISGQNRTLLDSATFKTNIMKYVKINQKNFWLKWFNIDLKEKQNKKNENEEIVFDDEEDDMKQKTLFNVCSNMIELEIPKTTIKNICDEINDRVFGKTTELGKQVQDVYIQHITSAKYVSKNI